MTVLTFPSNPTNGQQYAAPNGIQYVFDGVKWIVETTSSSSEAVSNSTQDRVAPMFVNGTHDGITFSYDAATNVMSAAVTAVNSDSLINGVRTLKLESNGNITAPAFTIPNTAGTSGQVLKWPSSGSTLAWGSDNNTTDRLVNGLNEVVLDATGALVHSGGSSTRTTSIVLTDTVTTRVVWTGSIFTSGAKLTIQVECRETGGVNYPSWETQVCEAIVAVRGYNTAALPVISVYGVTHTSVAPLMTFSVQRNPTTYLIEIVGTRTATASPLGNAELTIHSVETRSND